jgi:geranylgeranyl pyrophosphate synthase/predicted secreted hydrolase
LPSDLEVPIDLTRHDLPHRSSMTEWWYANAHVETVDGRHLSVFAAFFRIVAGKNEATGEPTYAHSLSWALVDADGRTYYSDTLVDQDAPRLGLERLTRAEQGEKGASKDPRVRRELRELLERGQVPYPDHMFVAAPFVAERRLELEFDGNRFEKIEAGHYRLTLYYQHWESGVELDFRIAPNRGPVRHGEDGVVRGPDGADMFYYFVPRLAVTGRVTIGGAHIPVASGQGWYDHEFGGHASEASAAESQTHDEVAWNWIAAQLADGSELTAYTMTDLATQQSLGQCAVLIDQDGTRHAHTDATLEPLNAWRSTRTFNTYPTKWRLLVPSANVDVVIAAAFDDQELVTLISKPAFWEGRATVAGTIGTRAVEGIGFIERSGYLEANDLESFFKAVGKEVRRSVANLLPLDPTFEQVRDLIASEARAHYMDGVDLAQFVKTGVNPVRAITDRGGKGWRSYAALACCDVVGGDSRDFVHWLAMPELMHVGSLIVDDVQDRSTVRRGGPACHVIYGEPLAINAGTSCYFMGQHLLQGTHVSNVQKLRLYDLYFEALRAGHAGQAADLEGLHSYMPRAVETGDVAELESRVVAIHRLKTAAPAGALARMGALVGGGSEAQIEGLGRYFEAVGVAFQMIDDVLNLRGFAGDLKTVGEDLMHGKVTLPVVHALGALGAADRTWLWEQIRAKPQDPLLVAELVGAIERTGALDRTDKAARDLIETAWQAVDPLLEPSIVKLMLRAFGWFVLERHY